ncbi:hypothetical protein WN943_020800 [Citrus x changshan-huyou]
MEFDKALVNPWETDYQMTVKKYTETGWNKPRASHGSCHLWRGVSEANCAGLNLSLIVSKPDNCS